MDFTRTIKIALRIVVLDEEEIKKAKENIKNADLVWLVIIASGLSAFVGQYVVTRSYLFAPDFIWLAYHSISVVILLFLFLLFSYLLAYNTLSKVHWNDFFVPAGLGTLITWITIIPYFTIVSLWYIAVMFVVIRTIFECTVEKASLIVLGSIIITVLVYNLLTFWMGWPSLYWFI